MVSVLISSWFHLSQRFSASCASTLRRSKATSTRARRSRGSWWHLSCSKFWRPWSYPKLRCRDYVDEIITVYCDGLSCSGVSLRRVEAIPAREREREMGLKHGNGQIVSGFLAGEAASFEKMHSEVTGCQKSMRLLWYTFRICPATTLQNPPGPILGPKAQAGSGPLPSKTAWSSEGFAEHEAGRKKS